LRHFSRLKDENIIAQEYLKYSEGLEANLDKQMSGGVKSGAKKKGKKDKKSEGEKETDDGEIIDEMEVKRLQELANAFHVYNQLLLDNNALDFGDLITYTLKLFKERPNILKFYQQKFKYVMVDEFQDTNWAQYELVKMLSAKNNNLVVVGDDDQSIYKFRGASISNILQFKDDYSKTKEVVLTKNYRSNRLFWTRLIILFRIITLTVWKLN
jgi:DNA helicase-2/ATP-dependent DNA helicase PcrA